MEENTVENIEDSMKYYCRVCTANTRSINSKNDDCIEIFKRTGLKSILEKYLQLQILVDDPLPKVVCKVCFDKIEAIEFLRVIARRTDALLREYLRNKLDIQPRMHSQFQNEFNSFAISMSTPAINKHDEVVVNVSVSNPLTKDIDKKLLVAQRKKGSLEKAFTPKQVNRVATTSTPNAAPSPVTIVHQMPMKKLPLAPHLLEKKKKLQIALTNATTVTLENPPPVQEPPHVKLPPRPNIVPVQLPPLRPISDAPTMKQKVEIHPVMNAHTLGQGVPLGSIIKDEDLLKLILKALKWPFNNQTLSIQIQRLKNTNFTDVIFDPNLLQDADLIQILGPLIHPKLVPISLVPQLQTYHISIPPEPVQSATISYKLPAETSVQIITVPLEGKASSASSASQKSLLKASTSKVRNVTKKKQHFVPIAPKFTSTSVIVVSDESEDEALKELSVREEPQRFEVQLDPSMYPGIGESSNSNEAMLATLNRQRETMMRMHRSKRKQSLMGMNVEMVDDIMIVDEGVQMDDQYPEVVLVKKPRKSVTPMASITTAKPSKGPPSVADPQGNVLGPPASPQQLPQPTSAAKLPTLPMKKLPTLLPNMKKAVPPTKESTHQPQPPTVPAKLPVWKDKPNPVVHKVSLQPSPSIIPQYNPKSSTLADADSTTKIVIKETKVPKPPSNSADIEEHIIKVRIGKQKSISPPAEDDPKSSSDEEVLIVVEYEDKDEEEPAEEKELKIDNKIESKDVTVENTEPVLEVVLEQVSTVVESSEMEIVNLSPVESKRKSSEFELPAIEIKEEEDQQEVAADKGIVEIKEENIDSDEKSYEKAESSTESPKTSQRNFVASRTGTKTVPSIKTRSSHKQKIAEGPKTVVTTFRPARKSKTLSKYYKGPPTATSSASIRSMRSRT